MAILFAALSSLVYGSADFVGGIVARRNHGVVVALVSQIFGLATLVIALAVWPHVHVTVDDLGWGLLAGVGGGGGLALFYPALAKGPMSIVAPLTALLSAVIPMVVGFATGDRPSAVALTGALLALPAIVLVARESGSHGKIALSTVLDCLGASAGFGLFYVALSRTSSHAGLWPLAAARIASLSVLGGLCLAARRSPRPSPGSLSVIAGVGVFDMAANALYLLAATRGLLSLVSVVGALYPAVTVVCAVIFLRERLLGAQLIGLVLAGVAVSLVAVGA